MSYKTSKKNNLFESDTFLNSLHRLHPMPKFLQTQKCDEKHKSTRVISEITFIGYDQRQKRLKIKSFTSPLEQTNQRI
jgi:hypothetical protein